MLTLYQLDGCPYCERVFDRLEELEVDYDSVWMDAMHSDRDEVNRVSSQRGVPVVVDDDYGVTMAESERILGFLETTHARVLSGSEVEAAYEEMVGDTREDVLVVEEGTGDSVKYRDSAYRQLIVRNAGEYGLEPGQFVDLEVTSANTVYAFAEPI